MHEAENLRVLAGGVLQVEIVLGFVHSSNCAMVLYCRFQSICDGGSGFSTLLVLDGCLETFLSFLASQDCMESTNRK